MISVDIPRYYVGVPGRYCDCPNTEVWISQKPLNDGNYVGFDVGRGTYTGFAAEMTDDGF